MSGVSRIELGKHTMDAFHVGRLDRLIAERSYKVHHKFLDKFTAAESHARAGFQLDSLHGQRRLRWCLFNPRDTRLSTNDVSSTRGGVLAFACSIAR